MGLHPELTVASRLAADGLAMFAIVWLAVYDARNYRLPDLATVSLAVAGFVFALATRNDAAVHRAVLGFCLGWLVYFLPEVVYRIRYSGRCGTGLGDGKFLAAMGVWLGPPVIAVGLFGMALGAVDLRRRQGGRQAAAPFGPYLAAPGVVVLCIQAWHTATLALH